MRNLALSLLSALGLAACASDLPPPAIAPTPQAIAAPDLDPDAKLASHTVVTDFAAPRDELQAWLFPSGVGSTDPNGFGRIVLEMVETEKIRKPVAADYLSGDWPEQGAVRRLQLSDGHYVLERVLDNSLPESFTYQIWGYTTKAGQNIAYVLGEQTFEPLPDGGTRFIWTYGLKPRQAWKRPFVQGFVDSDIGPFLDGAMERVAERADAEIGPGAADR